jgi:hypothetical protein
MGPRADQQRPIDVQRQQEHDSGKQKMHTDKNILLVNNITNKVIYMSPTVAGTTYDKRQRRPR